MILLLSLLVFVSVHNSLLVIAEITSSKLLDNILSIPSLDASNIRTIVFKIILTNCSVIICTFLIKYLFNISIKFSIILYFVINSSIIFSSFFSFP